MNIHLQWSDLIALSTSVDAVRDGLDGLDIAAALDGAEAAMPGSTSAGRVAAAAGLFGLIWPDASRNLLHYLENTGEPQQINVNRMMKDMPELDENTQRDVKDLANQAKNDAISSGASGPVTYTFSTAWKSEYTEQKEHPNWFYATGGYQRATEGTVTVYPPTEDNPEWTYKYNYRVHVADRYNWDGKKAIPIGPLTITDKELQELHKSGLAQEYDLIGESSVVSGP